MNTLTGIQHTVSSLCSSDCVHEGCGSVNRWLQTEDQLLRILFYRQPGRHASTACLYPSTWPRWNTLNFECGFLHHWRNSQTAVKTRLILTSVWPPALSPNVRTVATVAMRLRPRTPYSKGWRSMWVPAGLGERGQGWGGSQLRTQRRGEGSARGNTWHKHHFQTTSLHCIELVYEINCRLAT